MDIIISNYHSDITEKELRTFLYSGKIGIYNIEKDIKTLPSFDRVVTSDKYIFVEANSCWGILDRDLHLIAPPIYKEIIPVNEIDRDCFISSCQFNQDAASVTLSLNNNLPTHIAIQKIEIDTPDRYGIDFGLIDYKCKEEEKAFVYEITNNLERSEADLFVLFSDEDSQLISITGKKIKYNAGFRGYSFFPLWHYKDNMFIVRNKNGSYVTSTYENGRFTRNSLWGEYNDSFDEFGSPKIVLHRGGFVSVCYPKTLRISGFPNTAQFRNKENEFHNNSGMWALFKYIHKEAKGNDDWWDWYNLTGERSTFEQLTSFVYEAPMTQTKDDNTFVCHGDGMDILMVFEQNGTERSEALNVDEKYKTKPCTHGTLNIIACYDSIEQREDGLFDITTKDGCGLCSTDMSILVPPKYDYPIGEWGIQLMIVCQHGKYGVINKKTEEIVSCQYDYIQIGKGEFRIWDRESDWDELLNESVPHFSIRNKNEISTSDNDLAKEGFLIVGILNGVSMKPSETPAPNTLLKELTRIAAKKDSSEIKMTCCDIYSSDGQLLSNCEVSKSGVIELEKDLQLLLVFDYFKQYGIYIEKASSSILTSDNLSNDIYSLNGNSSEGYCELEEIIITKDVSKVQWNGLGRYRFRKFNVVSDNTVFCEAEGVLYTQKGYDRNGRTYRKQMIELVACPTNVISHDVKPGTKRIANCAFKGSKIERLCLPDTLEEIGVNAFYLTPNLKYLKLPSSIRKIETQDVGKSGDTSPQIDYNGHCFANWDELYEYMLCNGFEKRNGNIVQELGTYSVCHSKKDTQLEHQRKIWTDEYYLTQYGMTREEYFRDNYNEVNTLTALCLKNEDEYYHHEDYSELEIGKTYKVTHIGVFRSFTRIMLEDFGDKEYNSVCFEIFENGEYIDRRYTRDRRFLAPYLRDRMDRMRQSRMDIDEQEH